MARWPLRAAHAAGATRARDRRSHACAVRRARRCRTRRSRRSRAPSASTGRSSTAHFASKEELFALTVDALPRRARPAARRGVDPAPARPRERAEGVRGLRGLLPGAPGLPGLRAVAHAPAGGRAARSACREALFASAGDGRCLAPLARILREAPQAATSPSTIPISPPTSSTPRRSARCTWRASPPVSTRSRRESPGCSRSMPSRARPVRRPTCWPRWRCAERPGA